MAEFEDRALANAVIETIDAQYPRMGVMEGGEERYLTAAVQREQQALNARLLRFVQANIARDSGSRDPGATAYLNSDDARRLPDDWNAFQRAHARELHYAQHANSAFMEAERRMSREAFVFDPSGGFTTTQSTAHEFQEAARQFRAAGSDAGRRAAILPRYTKAATAAVLEAVNLYGDRVWSAAERAMDASFSRLADGGAQPFAAAAAETRSMLASAEARHR